MNSLDPDHARRFLVGHHGLRAVVHPTGAPGVRSMLQRRRCIQLDPLAPIGTNADLVAIARVDDLHVGEVYSALLPGHAFEHFSKERCLIPADRFATWRSAAQRTPLWRSTDRMRDLPSDVLHAVETEIRERGPLAVADLTARGRAEPTNDGAWKGTSKLATLAVQVLWRQCRIVVCGRAGRGKVVDVPERALPESGDPLDFDRSVLIDRVEAAGLLSENAGPHWSMLRHLRRQDLCDSLVNDGVLERVTVTGARPTYLAPAGFRDRTYPDDDGRMRILGPLDSMLWDRRLVRHAFGFEYMWEVYKPAAKRRWGWYVVPLLHAGQLVGRLEARAVDGVVRVDTVWREHPDFDEDAFVAAIGRLEHCLRPRPVLVAS